MRTTSCRHDEQVLSAQVAIVLKLLLQEGMPSTRTVAQSQRGHQVLLLI